MGACIGTSIGAYKYLLEAGDAGVAAGGERRGAHVDGWVALEDGQQRLGRVRVREVLRWDPDIKMKS